MGQELRKLELEKVLRADAAEIVAAREKAILIHHSGDIDAAGDEVEEAVRAVLRRKLPSAYYIGHGHVVDSEWHTSPQLDVILADNAGSPILFRAQNGTEYFPYESVYAFGEVKSTYYKNKRYIQDFANTVATLKTELKRQQTPMTYFPGGMALSESSFRIDGVGPYKNPLFSFMLFVEANDFDIDHIAD